MMKVIVAVMVMLKTMSKLCGRVIFFLLIVAQICVYTVVEFKVESLIGSIFSKYRSIR